MRQPTKRAANRAASSTAFAVEDDVTFYGRLECTYRCDKIAVSLTIACHVGKLIDDHADDVGDDGYVQEWQTEVVHPWIP